MSFWLSTVCSLILFQWQYARIVRGRQSNGREKQHLGETSKGVNCRCISFIKSACCFNMRGCCITTVHHSSSCTIVSSQQHVLQRVTANKLKCEEIYLLQSPRCQEAKQSIYISAFWDVSYTGAYTRIVHMLSSKEVFLFTTTFKFLWITYIIMVWCTIDI